MLRPGYGAVSLNFIFLRKHLLQQRKMAVKEDDENVYIELSKNPIRFEPVSKVTNVFFDDSNRQVLYNCNINRFYQDFKYK